MRAWDVDAVASVVVRGRSKVPSIYTVGGPGAAVFGWLVYYASRAWRCYWCAVEIKRTVQLCFCRHYWVETGRAEEVECQGSIGYEVVPEMQVGVGVAAAEAGDELILVSLDCTFCGVGVVKVWENKL